MLSRMWGHILMLQPLNLLPGSVVSHTALTRTVTASGGREALVPVPQGASVDAGGNVPPLGAGDVQEDGEGIECLCFSLFRYLSCPEPCCFLSQWLQLLQPLLFPQEAKNTRAAFPLP